MYAPCHFRLLHVAFPRSFARLASSAALRGGCLNRSSDTAKSSTRPTTMPCQNTPTALMIIAFSTSAMKSTPRMPPTIVPFAALEAGAAEHGGGDDLELDADAGVDHRAVQPRRTEHAGKPGEHAHDDEGDQRQPLDADAGELRRPRIAADEVELPEEAGRGDQPAADQHHHQHHPEQRLDAEAADRPPGRRRRRRRRSA